MESRKEQLQDFKEVYAIARNRNSTAPKEKLTVSDFKNKQNEK